MRGLHFVSLAVAALAVVQVSAASDSWTDPGGDSNGAPDIRSLYLQDNWIGKKGWMSFQPSTGGFGPGTLTLEIDADSKASTGAAGGSDYRVEWNLAGETTRLLRWNGSRFVAWKTPLVEPHFRGEPSVNIYVRAIGNPRTFRLWLHSTRRTASDRAPNRGYWTHEVPR